MTRKKNTAKETVNDCGYQETSHFNSIFVGVKNAENTGRNALNLYQGIIAPPKLRFKFIESYDYLLITTKK